MAPRNLFVKRYIGNELESNRRKIPPLLQVCGESRVAALRRYEIPSDIDIGYVDFGLDTVYFRYVDCFSLACHIIFPSESEARLQSVAIDIDWMYLVGKDLMKKFCRCLCLQEIIFVVNRFGRDRVSKLSANLPNYECMEDYRLHEIARGVLLNC